MASLSYRQLRAGDRQVGLMGLVEIFSALRDAGRPADPLLVPELLAQVRQHNYIPPAAEPLYGEALLQAYTRYLEEADAPASRPRLRPWRGIPREQVPWFPTMYVDRCDGCGRCLSFRTNGVFAARGERSWSPNRLLVRSAATRVRQSAPRERSLFPRSRC